MGNMTRYADLHGQNVLITGTSGGLGSVIAQVYLDAGAKVACHARTEERARAAAGALTGADGAAAPVWGDLTKDTANVVTQAVDAFGSLNGLVNNAGLQPVEEFGNLTRDAWHRVVDVNLNAVHDLTREVSTVLHRGGWVTHIASIEGVRPAAGHAHYASAKAGVIMHAKAAALELGARGIRVNTVSPGLIARPGIEQQWPEGVASWQKHAPLGDLIPPEQVAAACTILASESAAFITGHNLVVDGGMLATPGW